MAFATPVTYTHPNQYDTQFVIDIRRLRPVFSHLAPEVRDEIARAFRNAYPDLLVIPLPNGTLSFEKV